MRYKATGPIVQWVYLNCDRLFDLSLKVRAPANKRENVRRATSKAANEGKLIRRDCECCGLEASGYKANHYNDIQAHHKSYNRDWRKYITWLCNQCHAVAHWVEDREGWLPPRDPHANELPVNGDRIRSVRLAARK